jgi:hypothetical protein
MQSTGYQTPQTGWLQVCTSGSGLEVSHCNFTKVVCILTIEKPASIYEQGDFAILYVGCAVRNCGSSIMAHGNIMAH